MCWRVACLRCHGAHWTRECPAFIAKMKLAYERKRDSYWKFSLDSHDSIIQNDICANSGVEMKDSENDVTPVSQPALVQDVGS